MVSPERTSSTWVYESIIDGIPGVSLSASQAVLLQFLIFEVLALLIAAWYGIWEALGVGTVAIGIAAVGSGVMLSIGQWLREADLPAPYPFALFDSRVALVLGLVAFIAAVVYLFVQDPRTGTGTILTSIFGQTPPLAAVFLLLVVVWDLSYRIGVGWWTAVVLGWFSVRSAADITAPRRSAVVRSSLVVIAYAFLQLALLPFLVTHPIAMIAIVGHVVAVGIVAGAVVVRLWRLPTASSETV